MLLHHRTAAALQAQTQTRIPAAGTRVVLSYYCSLLLSRLPAEMRGVLYLGKVPPTSPADRPARTKIADTGHTYGTAAAIDALDRVDEQPS